MKTLLAASALAALSILSGATIETGISSRAQAAGRSCSQICANAAQSTPQELCVKRCQAVRAKNAAKQR
jgi:hypothetical protein